MNYRGSDIYKGKILMLVLAVIYLVHCSCGSLGLDDTNTINNKHFINCQLTKCLNDYNDAILMVVIFRLFTAGPFCLIL